MAGWGQKDRAGDGLGKTNAEKNPLPRGHNHAVGTPDKYGDIPLFGIDMEVFHIYEKCGIIHTSPAPGTRLCGDIPEIPAQKWESCRFPIPLAFFHARPAGARYPESPECILRMAIPPTF